MAELKLVLLALKSHPGINLQLVAGASGCFAEIWGY